MFWWEFNKDPFINLKATVHQPRTVINSDSFFMTARTACDASDSLRPTTTEIDLKVVPTLLRTLNATDQRDIISSCLVALAKIGRDSASVSVLDQFRKRLVSRDQEIRETAALAMGIWAKPEAIEDLQALLLDTQHGRRLVDRSVVDVRTRAYAAYALGLIAHAQAEVAVKNRVAGSLAKALETAEHRNLSVSVINALGLLNLRGDDPGTASLRADALASLDHYFHRDLGPSHQMIQAHVPLAVANLLEDTANQALRDRYVSVYVEVLNRGHGRAEVRANLTRAQSAAMALGRLAKPHEAGSPHAHVSKALLKCYRECKDKQTGYFALMSLGRIGGSENREILLKELAAGTKALEKP